MKQKRYSQEEYIRHGWNLHSYRKVSFNQIQDVNFRVDDPTIFAIEKDGEVFEFLINYRTSIKKAVIFGTGAVMLGTPNPCFVRHSWASDISCTSIWYADPTIYDTELTLGWGYGRHERWYLDDIASILKVILIKLDIEISNTLFFGSSGGGTTAAFLAAIFRSRAIVINAQLNAQNYFQSYYKKFKDTIIQIDGSSDIIQQRLDLFLFLENSGFFKCKNQNKWLHLIVNKKSEEDMEWQLKHFMKRIKKNNYSNSFVNLDLYEEEGGHSGMPSKEDCLRWIIEDLDLPTCQNTPVFTHAMLPANGGHHMSIFKRIKDGGDEKILLFNIPVYKREHHFGKKRYSILGIPVYSRKKKGAELYARFLFFTLKKTKNESHGETVVRFCRIFKKKKNHDGKTISLAGIPLFKKRIRNGREKTSIFGIPVGCRKIKSSSFSPFGTPLDSSYRPLTIDYNICDMHFLEHIRPALENISSSQTGRWYEPCSYRMGWLSDDILYDAFKSAAPGIMLNPDKWQEQIKDIDIFFFISCWNGLHGEWSGIASEGSKARKKVYEIIEACRNNNIPTIFYTCEDPPSYKDYIGIAKKCDHIFTSAEEMIPHYKTDCGHDRVYSLIYGINPYFHNPVGMRSTVKSYDVLFAGSWYSKFKERCEDTLILFDGVLQSGRNLKIIDRCLHLNAEQHIFPEKYHRYSSPAVNHEQLQKIQKLYDWCLNLNSVKTSQTMFANRCFELLASGNLLISNYSVGVNSILPLIFTCQHSDEVARILNSFTPEEVYERQTMGIRFALNGNTCFDRMAQILNTIGLSAEVTSRRVAVVGDGSEAVRAAFERQTFTHKELLSPEELRVRFAEFDIVTFFHADAFYGEFYLEDMCNGFKYTDVDAVTKDAWKENGRLHRGKEHEFVDTVRDKYRTVFWSRAFSAEELLSLNGELSCRAYSIDHFEYESAPAPQLEEPREYALSVILPVYNNGMQLYGKAFASLRRSSMFENMEIILVDDGSTDGRTPSVIRHLEKRYPNVRSFFFNDGGSGSASRPRNKGVELSTAKHITFLDPDNEAINNSYAVLYEKAIQGNFDLVVGDLAICRENERSMMYYHAAKKYLDHDILKKNKEEFFANIKFEPIPIQGMIIDRNIITENNLIHPLMAIGEDSLYSLELIYNAKKVLFMDIPSHIYYAKVVENAVNSVSVSFFKKAYLCEVEQIKWLKETGLLADYMKLRFTPFFCGWYLEKLAHAKPEDVGECKRMLRKIFDVYADVYTGSDSRIEVFLKETDSLK